MLAVGGFVAVALHVPGKDPNLVVVVGQAIPRLGQDTEILGDALLPSAGAGGVGS